MTTTSAIAVKRIKGQTTCPYHQGRDLDWICEECSHELICAKCVYTLHKGHKITELSEFIYHPKREIQNFIDDSERNKLPELQKHLDSTEENLQKNSKLFEELRNEMKKQGDTLKDEIDVLVAQNLCMFKELENENDKFINIYLKELQEEMKQLKDQIQRCKDVIQSGTNIEVFDVRGEIKSHVSLSMEPRLGSAKFSVNKTPQDDLKLALGKIDVSPPTYPQGEILSEFKAPCQVSSICPTNDGGAWLCGQGNVLTQLGENHKVLQQINHPVSIKDICLLPSTNNLLVCSSEDKSITEIVSLTPTPKFSTDMPALCLCVTTRNQILVGMKQKLIQFTSEGKEVLTTRLGGLFWKPIVYSPHRATQCSLTENVAVVDWDNSVDGGYGKPNVSVIDRGLQARLSQFNGNQDVNKAGTRPFDPSDVVYDKGGNLIVSEYNNKCIHLLSGTCDYIRVLHVDRMWISALGIDRSGVLWVVLGSDVKLLKYTTH